MVVGAVVLDDVAAPEHLTEEFERRSRGCCLCDGELVLDLPAESASRVPHHGDRETAFAVDEADDPLLDTWPFLLIARTERIFTASKERRVPSDTRVFQHIASCTQCVTALRGSALARQGIPP